MDIDKLLREEKLKNAIETYKYLFKNGIQSVPSEWIHDLLLPELYDAITKNHNITYYDFSPLDYLITINKDGTARCNQYTGGNNLIVTKEHWEELKNRIDKFYEKNDINTYLENLFIKNINKAMGVDLDDK